MYSEIKKNLEESSLLVEMANLDKELTGLKVNLWIDSSGQKRDIKHSPYRIKMQNNYRRLIDSNDMIPISIDKENPENIDKIKLKIKTKDYNEVKQFIKDNYEDLCLLIQNKITDRELIHRLEDKLNKKKGSDKNV